MCPSPSSLLSAYDWQGDIHKERLSFHTAFIGTHYRKGFLWDSYGHYGNMGFWDGLLAQNNPQTLYIVLSLFIRH